MSTTLSAPAPAQGVGWPSWARGLGAAVKRGWVAYLLWRNERAAAARLASMSDRELNDIGLTRSGIATAVRGADREQAFNRYF